MPQNKCENQRAGEHPEVAAMAVARGEERGGGSIGVDGAVGGRGTVKMGTQSHIRDERRRIKSDIEPPISD